MPDPDGLTWLVVENFTAGVITNAELAQASGPVPGTQPGQAQTAVGCIGLPNGGLAPLPGYVSTIGLPSGLPDAGYTIVNAGLFIGGPLFTGGTIGGEFTDQLVLCFEEYDGAAWKVYLYAINLISGMTTSAWQLLADYSGATGFTGISYFTGETTSANATPADIGVPTLALAYWPLEPDEAGSYYGYLLYPDPTGPGSNSPNSLAEGNYDAICHQNRIIGLTNSSNDWGATGIVAAANEIWQYTDPPNSLAFGTQDETFVQEHPFGHGTWGSISASELFLVKHNGGGYVIQGDLNAPTVTRLPGVTSTYGLMSRGGDTTIGFVYASKNRGLWAWNGGTSAQKISNQLQDNFFVNPNLITIPYYHGPTVDVRGWGDWIVTTNDWICDTNTGGWWQLTTPASPHLQYAVSATGDYLYATVVTPTGSRAIDVYSRLNPSTTYVWISYPMRLPDASTDRNYTIQQVVVRAQGDGTVTIVLAGVNGTNSSAETSPSDTLTFTTTAQPSMQMLRTGLVAQDVTVEIISTGVDNLAAPIVYSVAIGVGAQNPVSAT